MHHPPDAPTRRGALVTRSLFVTVLAVTVLCPALSPVPAAASGVSVSGEPVSAAELDRFAAAYVERRGLPGAAVAVTLDGETVHTGGYGVDGGGEPLRADTPMRIASLSKSMTALAVMQLVEGGDVELDRPVYDYLPGFGITDPRGARITVRQLLDQSSGMSDQGFSPVDRPRRPTSLDEAVAQMDGAGLSAAPGEEWEYHNPNYHVAARLVEVVGGRPFTEYMEEHVFAPAGMDDTSSPDPATGTVPDPARGHVRAYGLNIPAPEPEHFSTGAGGVVSTAEDMARWVILQGDGGRAPDGTELVSAESVELMHTPSAPNGRYGLGWMRRGPEDGAGADQVWHGGMVSTYSSYQVLVPSTGYGFVALFNSGITLTEEDTWGLVEGLIALTEGREPPVGDSVLWKVDAAFGALTLLALVLGTRGVLRARGWASRRAGRPRWRVGPTFLPYLVPPAALLGADSAITLVMGGREGTWLQRFYGVPAELTFLAVAALACLAVIAARTAAVVRARRSA
ncbi:CubicO group peptidase (beta-lactamase class C family) [Nocardiopsis arvandica]|uniref:CubicO group peptidase (Beta-lactamase class C family) n=1 Tax=Nocardiopsis sinuspersici TaxID=501010 RepID=A0A7Y9XBT1_9ACTN|nr:serine hydrolase domain-containing protein [Nocardiopsis sinuspersici]NYH52896.1 CubicO group peptidase (beta-lactamase class C family) [Nocardiopsis sinuspersici]